MKRSLIRMTLVGLLCGSSTLFAQGAIDEKADALMRTMASEIGSAKTLAFIAETTVDEVTASGQKLQRGALVSALVRRPDRLLAIRDGDLGVRKFAYADETITIVDSTLNLYTTAEAPGGIDQALVFVREKFGLVLPLGDLIQTGLYEEIRPKVKTGRYLGRHRVGRVPCHHLAYTMESVDWQIWIEDGPRALPRKLVVTYKTLPESPQFSATIGEWRLSEKILDKSLMLVIPEDADRIELLQTEGGER